MLQYLKDYKDAFNIIITAFTAVVGMFTLISTIVKIINEAKNYVKDKRDKQLFDYVNTFSDKEKVRRLSGVNGLTNYASIMFKELFYICALEEDALIKELLQNALLQICPKKKESCKEINQFFVQYMVKQDISIREEFDSKTAKEFRSILKKGNTESRIQWEIAHKGKSISSIENEEVEECLLLSSQLMSRALKRILNQPLKGVLFEGSSLYKAHWINITLKNAALLDNIGRHAKGFKIYAEEVLLWKNDFYGSLFTGLSCKRIYIYHTTFRESTFIKFSIQGVLGALSDKTSLLDFHRALIIEDITFSQSKFFYTKVALYRIVDGKWNGCKLYRCNFLATEFIDNKMRGINSSHCEFDQVNFYKDKMQGIFNQCSFNNVKWGGSTLKGSKFVKCTFKNVDFAGADLANVIFENCDFENANVFKGTQNMNPNNIIGKNASAYILANKE